MASRGNNNSGGGCLASIIAFFVLFFLPAWVTGDDFGWGVLIVWWLILVGIPFLMTLILLLKYYRQHLRK